MRSSLNAAEEGQPRPPLRYQLQCGRGVAQKYRPERKSRRKLHAALEYETVGAHPQKNREPQRRRSALLAVAMAIPLAVGITGCASRSGTPGAEAGNGRLPRFETASIKPYKLQRPLVAGRLIPGMPLAGVRLSDGNFAATTIVTAMIMDAYGQYMRWLSANQVLGGPAWIRTDFYQINAKVKDSVVNGQWKKLSIAQRWNEAMLMLRSLLIKRFKLRVRHETKVLPVYELVLPRNGPKITKDKTDNGPCRMDDVGWKGHGLNVSCDFSKFVKTLSILPEFRGRVLVDKTGLQGRYSFKLHWTPSAPMPARGGQGNHNGARSEPSGPSLFVALREQLGLKVVSATAPVDVIVIEHIERPISN